MNSEVVEVDIKGTLPTNGGCAVFLGNEDKVFVIYIDQMVGNAITMLMKDLPLERPQTHDLFGHVLEALGAKVQRVVINDFKDEVYYGRLIIKVENELEEKKILEIDARSSDCIALAVQSKVPVYVANSVLDKSDDVTEVFKRVNSGDFIQKNGLDDLIV
ncbi:MAG: hypothetical protein CMO46_01205 [Verrucomicrobiales bacterium]|nr:hypothetical protein [Verrucomicrobiales bacterium]MBD29193.1 hypothetical protein [Verrucomicrobiaceae bacterium]MBV64153.1 hypothetical protein [Rickettsiales bacterium]|tara:strand:+ start:9214 stop:9693 length:480 start_codon:yes stop_codon:yes gene_type:complete